ncbi:MAG: metalloregulator ArsR/SmtB family transcription factor [Bacteroidetes bacterium]|jgi:DNA-binding transcriptional ArsR family regulator|nr:metalloregulator ArsR/SmtB family transcription factor [Bacteroidota bacterium]
MGLTKTENFTVKQNQIAGMAKALAHPARIAILQEIIKAKSCICGDLVSRINLSQPTISQHLRELKNAGLIKGDIEGTRVCYCIDEHRWKLLRNTFNTFINQVPENQDNCC